MPDRVSKTITLTDRDYGLPFSKGLLAQSLMATGLPPRRAYEVAQAIQEDLRDRDETSISMDRLRELTHGYVRDMCGPEHARRYLRMRDLARLTTPVIVLLGGTTGVGKSTIAQQVAHRLGITRVESTDSVRQVMRGIFTRDLMPALHESAFEAWRGLRVPVPQGADPVVVGFREQTALVSTGVKALIDRAVEEGLSLVLEGVHLVPGYLDPSAFEGARVVHLVLRVDDEQSHLSHFYTREMQTQGGRPLDRYRDNFPSIRRLGDYVDSLAVEHGIPLVTCGQLDAAVAEVVEHVISGVLGES